MHIPASKELLCGCTRSSNAEQLPVGPEFIRPAVVHGHDPHAQGEHQVLLPVLSPDERVPDLQGALGVWNTEGSRVPALDVLRPSSL